MCKVIKTTAQCADAIASRLDYIKANFSDSIQREIHETVYAIAIEAQDEYQIGLIEEIERDLRHLDALVVAIQHAKLR